MSKILLIFSKEYEEILYTHLPSQFLLIAEKGAQVQSITFQKPEQNNMKLIWGNHNLPTGSEWRKADSAYAE